MVRIILFLISSTCFACISTLSGHHFSKGVYSFSNKDAGLVAQRARIIEALADGSEDVTIILVRAGVYSIYKGVFVTQLRGVVANPGEIFFADPLTSFPSVSYFSLPLDEIVSLTLHRDFLKPEVIPSVVTAATRP